MLFLAALAFQAPAPDLYTVELIGTPALRRFGGVADLQPARSPFTVAVTAEGVHRYSVSVSVDSLPDPSSLGPYSTFVVWAAPPTLAPMYRLGVLPKAAAGPVALGDVALNRFLLFVTAEPDERTESPTGPFVLRGLSPSMRLGMPHLVQASLATEPHAAHGDSSWTAPAPHPVASTMYMPGLAGLLPSTSPWLPRADPDPPPVKPRSLHRLADGDSLRLEARPVKRRVGNRTVTQYGFNGEQPGPLVDVVQGAVIRVNFVNRTELPTAIHWHGIRLENRFDGVPHLTQPPVAPGDSFRYEVRFPDAGIYWYHPHHREDLQQDLGLYGNLLVRDPGPDAWGPAHREEILMLDDLLVGDDGLFPYGEERATHALMGRFGNVMLVNGEPEYRLEGKKGEVVRFFLTNVANTRTFNLSFGGLPIKVVGSDLSKFERESFTDAVLIAYETVQRTDGSLPLLTPMSEVAGRLSVQEGAFYLGRAHGGRGVLLGGVPGVPRGNVVILGAGIVGMNALRTAVGLGADVSILDVNLDRLRHVTVQQAAARLHHTHIVPVFDSGEADGFHYYAMQFIDGQGLDAVVRAARARARPAGAFFMSTLSCARSLTSARAVSNTASSGTIRLRKSL